MRALVCIEAADQSSLSKVSGILAACLLLPACASFHGPSRTVAIQPLGAVPAEQLAAVRHAVADVHGLEAVILPTKPLPPAAFVASRDRYYADELLVTLDVETEARFGKVIGVTCADIAIDRDGEKASGVMGCAERGERAGVVSTHRLGFGGVAPALRLQRLARVAAHELGHTLGLPHCETPRCLMNDACGAVATVDASTGRLCWRCAGRVLWR